MSGNDGKCHTVESLVNDLRGRCGVSAGDVVIVHTSMKAIGRVEGGPGGVIASLQEAVGREGTILMPAFSSPPGDGVVDQRRTPSRLGVIPETFRTSAGVVRSAHATHSVCAWGARAEELIAGHERTSGLGVDSPLERAAKSGASVMMVGCRLTSCSLIHVAEARLRVPYLGLVTYPGYERTLVYVDERGGRRSDEPRDVPGDSQGFDVVEERLDRMGLIRRCRLGDAEVMKFSGMDCLSTAEGLLREDAAALLCHRAECAVCVASRRIVEQMNGSRSGR